MKRPKNTALGPWRSKNGSPVSSTTRRWRWKRSGPFQQPPPALAPDLVADVVAHDRRQRGDRDDQLDLQFALAGQHAADDHRGLAGHRHAARLRHHQQEQDRVAETSTRWLTSISEASMRVRFRGGWVGEVGLRRRPQASAIDGRALPHDRALSGLPRMPRWPHLPSKPAIRRRGARRRRCTPPTATCARRRSCRWRRRRPSKVCCPRRSPRWAMRWCSATPSTCCSTRAPS